MYFAFFLANLGRCSQCSHNLMSAAPSNPEDLDAKLGAVVRYLRNIGMITLVSCFSKINLLSLNFLGSVNFMSN